MAIPLATIVLCAVSLFFVALALRLFRKSDGPQHRAEQLIATFFLAIAAEILLYTVGKSTMGGAIGLAISVSSCALLAFVRTVFRREARWATWLAYGLGAALSVVYIVPHLLGEPTLAIRLAWSALRATALLWAVIECARFHVRMRRRVRLGLADPIVANRFLLWAFWTGGTAALPISGLGLRLMAWAGLVQDYTVTREATFGAFVYAAVIFFSLATAAISLWLSFYPPAFYKRWIASRWDGDDTTAAASAPA